MAQSVYSYKIEMSFMDNKKEIEIPSEMICQVVINYDYSDLVAPIVYTQLKLPITTYNKMQKNIKTGKVKLIIKKKDTKKKNSLYKVYIRKQLSYFFPNNSYDTDSDAKGLKTDESHRTVFLGLIDMSLVNSNKKLYNKLFIETSTFTIVHYLTRPTKMVMEPFDKNETHTRLYIPPLTSLPAVLNYLNRVTGFYNTNFRFFRDFNRGYLLSNKGKGINIGDGKYTSVHIDIENQLNNTNANLQGFMADAKNKCYIVQVNDNDYDINIDTTTDNIMNRFVGVKYKGGHTDLDLKINKSNAHSVKPQLVRLFNNNNLYLKSLANTINNNDTTVSISKTDLDCTIIEPHKEFIITNMKAFKSKNGKYLLYNKQETFVPEGDIFKCNILATFKKCK